MNAQAIEWYFQHLDQQGMALLAENYTWVDERLENVCLQDPEAGAEQDEEQDEEIQWDDAVLPWMLDIPMDISDDEADEDEDEDEELAENDEEEHNEDEDEEEDEQFCCDRCQGVMTEAQLQVHQPVCYFIPVELSLALAQARPVMVRHPMEIVNDLIIDEMFNDIDEEEDDALYSRKRNRSNWMDGEAQAAGYVSSDCEEAEVYPMEICEDDDEDEVPEYQLLQRATTRCILSDGSIVYNGNPNGDRFFDDVCSDDEELEPMV